VIKHMIWFEISNVEAHGVEAVKMSYRKTTPGGCETSDKNVLHIHIRNSQSLPEGRNISLFELFNVRIYI